jgi:hypothetical protein
MAENDWNLFRGRHRRLCGSRSSGKNDIDFFADKIIDGALQLCPRPFDILHFQDDGFPILVPGFFEPLPKSL